MTTTQFCEYILEIQKWASEFLAIDIPSPNENLEIFFKSCLLAPFIEEIWWRIIPIMILLKVGFERSFVFLIIAIVFVTVPEHNSELMIHTTGIVEGIVLSIVGYYFGSVAKKRN